MDKTVTMRVVEYRPPENEYKDGWEHGYFHQWVVVNNEVYALIEHQSNRMVLVRYDRIFFRDKPLEVVP